MLSIKSKRFKISLGLMITCSLLAFGISHSEAGKKVKESQILTKLSYDENAEKVDIFEGMEKGQLDVKVVHKDSLSANVYIENKSDIPLTVEIPDAVATKHVLKQLGAGVGATGGGAQTTGGGLGGAGGGGFGGGGGGFSIPPGKFVKIPYQSVCLEHGKKEPSRKMKYELVKIESVTDNAAVIELVAQLNNPRVDRMAAQAAVWRMENKISWTQLAAKMKNRRKAYFTPAEISQGKTLASMATYAALDKEENQEEQEEKAEEPRPVRKRNPRLSPDALN